MADGETKIKPELPPRIAVEAITRAPYAIVLTNPQLPDNPIVYVNRAFETLTGYTSDIAIGRNCRFLQGSDTEQKAIDTLRKAIANREETAVVLRNYRADGEMFLNRLMVAPLEADEDEVPYFLGVQTIYDEKDPGNEETLKALEEIQHRVKNHLSMIVGMIRLQARDSKVTAGSEFDTLARRVETLQLLYEEINADRIGQNRESEIVNLGAYLTRVANAIAYLDGRSGIRVNIDSDDLEVPMDTATQLGLAVSEVLTNAMQHAFVERQNGMVEVRIKTLSDDVLRIQISDDGVGIPKDVTWPSKTSLGGRIVKQLVTGLNAKLIVEGGASGTMIVIDVPKQFTITQ